MRDMFNKKRIMGLCSAALLLAAMSGAPAHAAAGDLVVTAGTLDFDPTGSPTFSAFGPVTLNGTPQLTSANITPFTVVDATGSGAGWHVLLTVPNLVNGGDTIAATNITMSAPVVQGAAGSSTTGLVESAVTGVGLAAGVTIVSAPLTDGEGTYLISPRILKVTVPDTAQVGTYTSLAVVTVVTAP
jgi:hypothetical protein